MAKETQQLAPPQPVAKPTGTIEQVAINTIRTLAMDAVETAKSGHPGTPMALAPVAYTLWNEVLRYDPDDPQWPARDRFILSCGHASMLLYSLLHLTGIKRVEHGRATDELAVPLDAIRHFRQLGSLCPGHPEHGETTGVETTTGPLGQGIGNSVGMAIAQRWLAAHFNRPGFELFDYNVYALCSDGDLMEGVGNEAASLAGHLKLSNLCWIYDDNHITIEGHTTLAYSDDAARRFEGLGWHVVKVADANDLAAIRAALASFHATTDRPTLIIVRSVIAWGAPHKANTERGARLAAGCRRSARDQAGLRLAPGCASFSCPRKCRRISRPASALAAASCTKSGSRNSPSIAEHPDLADQWQRMQARELPANWDRDIPEFPADPKGVGSRISSGKVLNTIAQHVPWLIGGAADLAPLTMTTLTFDGTGSFEPETMAAAIFTSASANTAWPPRSTACRCRTCGRSAPRSSSSAIICGRRCA